MSGYSRRLILLLGAAAVAGAMLPVRTAHTPDTSLTLLRRRWLDVTAGPGSETRPYRDKLARLGATAAAYRDTMTPAPASLWPGLHFPSFSETPARLRTMARAYALPGTGLTGEARLAAAVATGLDHYRRGVYAAGADPAGNWWHWEIGVPKALLDAALLIGPRLTRRQARDLVEAVDHFVPSSRLDDYAGTSTGANRVDLCTVTLLRAVLGDDPGRAALAAAALSPVLRQVSEGDGFYRDGSFIQHTWVPYQGGYGAVLLSGLATLLAVLRGSPWEVSAAGGQVVFDMVDRSFAPFVHDGFCMDLVSGRGIGRRPYGDHRRGHAIAAAMLLLAESAPAAERARWRAMVKGWAVRDTHRSMLGEAEPAFHARLGTVLADDAVPAAAEPAGHTLMPMSARAVHRRPDWCAALSMASDRIGHYEHGNGENLRGWHTGSGMLYWWAEGHGDHYSDSFWSTVDPYRLPGTTVSTRRLPDGAGAAWGDTCTPWRWVGGVTDGVHAAVGQHLSGLESTLEAFKAWFFLDDAVVCLGAGISCADGVPVETVVDNRRTGAPLTVDAGWAHLAGHGGYVLLGEGPAAPEDTALRTPPAAPEDTALRTPPGTPEDGRLRTLREERAAGPVSRRYVTLWLDHGVDPRSARYAYLLLPGATPAVTRARAADAGWVRVLANTPRQQGVRVASLGLAAVAFWNAGAVGGLTASAPCAVLVRERGDGTATVCVSDPRRDLDELTVTWDRPVAAVLDAPASLHRATTGARLTLRFGRLSDQEGRSQPVTVRLS